MSGERGSLTFSDSSDPRALGGVGRLADMAPKLFRARTDTHPPEPRTSNPHPRVPERESKTTQRRRLCVEGGGGSDNNSNNGDNNDKGDARVVVRQAC